jgi:hypothetical protein
MPNIPQNARISVVAPTTMPAETSETIKYTSAILKEQ